jgi:hypothetical protein
MLNKYIQLNNVYEYITIIIIINLNASESLLLFIRTIMKNDYNGVLFVKKVFSELQF